jgi:hypothetical protein
MIDLVVFNVTSQDITWPLGEVIAATFDAAGVNAIFDKQKDKEGATLFCDVSCGVPDSAAVTALLETSGEIFHAGNKCDTHKLLKLYYY